ncbi:hypothetical protein EGW08_000295, partial [Elysia chlorotica]
SENHVWQRQLLAVLLVALTLKLPLTFLLHLGGHIRVIEAAQLQAAGNERNLFADGSGQVLQLHVSEDGEFLLHLRLYEQTEWSGMFDVLALEHQLGEVARALQTVQVGLHLALALQVLHELLAVGGVKVVHQSLLLGAHVGDELDGRVVDALLGALGIGQGVLTERKIELHPLYKLHVVADNVDQETNKPNQFAIPPYLVLVKGAQHTDAGLTGLAVEPDHLILVLLALDVLLDLNVEHAVVLGYLPAPYPRLPVHVHAGLAQQLVAVEALAGGLAVLAVDQLADVAERELARLLPGHHLAQAAHQEVVRQLLHPAHGQLGSLPAQRARELAVVRVLGPDEMMCQWRGRV